MENAAGLGTVMLNRGIASYFDYGIFVNQNYNSQLHIIHVLISFSNETMRYYYIVINLSVELPCELKLRFPEHKITHSLKFLSIYVYFYGKILLSYLILPVFTGYWSIRRTNSQTEGVASYSTR